MFPPGCSKQACSSEVLEEMQPVMFFEYFALWIWVGEKDRQTGQRLGIPVSKVLMNGLPDTRLQGQVLMLISGLWRRVEGKEILSREQSHQGATGSHRAK